MDELFEIYKTFSKINKKIKSKQINDTLDIISSYTKSIVILDIEFMSYMSLNMKYRSTTEILDGEKIRIVKFPKEIAGIYLTKNEDSTWTLVGSFHFNLISPHLISRDMKLGKMKMMFSKYSTVEDKTNKQMEELEKKLFNDKKFILRFLNSKELKYNYVKQVLQGSHRIFMNNSGKHKSTLKNLFKLYSDDDQVKQRILSPSSTYKVLSRFWNYSNTIITKENMDIMAINNYLYLLHKKNEHKYRRVSKEFNHFDIKIFNGYFRKKFKSARLINNFKDIQKLKEWKDMKSFYTENFKKLFDVEHNPLTDSIMAFMIALTLMYKLNK